VSIDASGCFGLDAFVSSVVLWSFVAREGCRLVVAQLCAPIVASLLVGASLGRLLFVCL